MSNKYKIHNFINIYSDIDIYPNYFKVYEELDNINLSILQKNNAFFNPLLNSSIEILPQIFFNKEKNTIISNLKIYKYDIFCAFEDFDKNNSKIYFNSAFLKMKKCIKLPLSSIFPLEHFFKLILGLKLMQKEAILLHSGGLSINNKNILVSAFGAMGKTTLIENLLKYYKNKSKIISDDTVIYHQSKIYAYPQKFRIRKSSRFIGKDKYIEVSHKYNIADISQKISYIFVLENDKHNKKIEALTAKEYKDIIFTISSKTFPYFFERNISCIDYLYQFSNKFFEIKNNFELNSDCINMALRMPQKDFLNSIKSIIR